VLTVTTWNVQNLLPAGSRRWTKTQQTYDDELGALADPIQTLGPDMVAPQGSATQRVSTICSPGSAPTGTRNCPGDLTNDTTGPGLRHATRSPQHQSIRARSASGVA
jgi:hypothetical protein